MNEVKLNSYLICFDEKGIIKNIKNGNDEFKLNSITWDIEKGDNQVISPKDMTSFTYECKNDELKMYWKSDKDNVNVNIRYEDDFLKMKINVDTKDTLRRIRFPKYNSISKITEKDDKLVLPYQQGFLINDPIENLLKSRKDVAFWMGRGEYGKYENDYPAQYSYQFFAYYNPFDKGYYIASEDSNNYIKTITMLLNENDDTMNMIFTNYPEGMGEEKYYSLPYEYTFKFFKGDWKDSAKLYRKWAVKQNWFKPLKERKVSKIVKDIDFFRINHEHYFVGTNNKEYYDTTKMIVDKLNCTPCLHWYGWNKAPNHGDWYPEMAKFDNDTWCKDIKERNTEFDELGVYKIPYINTHLWDDRLDSFNSTKAQETLVVRENGEITEEGWGTHDGHKLYPICHATPYGKDITIKICKDLTENFDFDGVYIDQIASFNATLCFSKDHGHPVGGGSWWAKEYIKMLETLKSQLPEDKFLTTESCCEAYQNVFDLFLVLDPSAQDCVFNYVCGINNSDAIPLFPMIYNDSASLYGSICRFDNNDKQFEFNYMKCIIWGIIPTCEGMPLEEGVCTQETKWDILKRGVDFYKDNKEILFYGMFDNYYIFDDDTYDVTFGEQIKKCPYVIGSRFIYDGKTYTFLYNFSDTIKEVVIDSESIKVNPKEFTKIVF